MLKELNSSFHAEIYEIVWRTSIKPILKEWVSEIMTNPDLPEAERKGKIMAYNEILKGFLKMYENSKIERPEWLYDEFF